MENSSEWEEDRIRRLSKEDAKSQNQEEDRLRHFLEIDTKSQSKIKLAEVMCVGIVQLPRDSNGSIQVFDPQEFEDKSLRLTSENALQSRERHAMNHSGDGLKPQMDHHISEQQWPENTLNSMESEQGSWRQDSCIAGPNIDMANVESFVVDDAFTMPEPVRVSEDPHKDTNVQSKENLVSPDIEKEPITANAPPKSTANEFTMRKFMKDLSIADRPALGEFSGKSYNVELDSSMGTGSYKTWTDEKSTTFSLPTPGTSVRNSVDSTSRFETSTNSSKLPHISKETKDALSAFQHTFVVADATRPGYPVVYASAGFLKMSGYTATEVIGRNCLFLQGPDTIQRDLAKIRTSLAEGKSFCGRFQSYKKDGSSFWNLVTIAPVKDENGNLIKLISMQVEVSKYTEGLKGKALRPNGLPESLIQYDARQKDLALSSVSELVQVFRRPRGTINLSHHARAENKRLELLNALPRNRYFGSENIDPVNWQRRSSQWSARRWSETGIPSRREVASPVAKGRRRSLHFFSKFKPCRKSFSLESKAELEVQPFNEDEWPEFIDIHETREEARMGIDLATSLERIERNFVITDPRLPDNPIIFASDSFLDLTEYNREDVLGRNCRFLQGHDTDSGTIQAIRDAIKEQKQTITLVLNYAKSGRPILNLLHVRPVFCQKGELQYFIGVYLDGNEYLEPSLRHLADDFKKDNIELVRTIAANVETAVHRLTDANINSDDLWAKFSQAIFPKPRKFHSNSWKAIRQVCDIDKGLDLKHFRPIKFLGRGNTGSVYLVELQGAGEFYAMKTMDKLTLQNSNKVHRVFTEMDILKMVDHPFLPTLYGSFQTKTHVFFITDFCAGGELHLLLNKQPSRRFKEETTRFYAAELVVALEYLHCMGIVYRDLKPANVLIQRDGHISLTDFDLSFLTTAVPEIMLPTCSSNRHKKKKDMVLPKIVANRSARSNSFVGSEEYIAPEIIKGSSHNGAVDWWSLGVLVYEMLYGRTPFVGKSRYDTFSNVLNKDVLFPRSILVSLMAKQFIHALLRKEPTERLGSRSGAEDVKNHPFFDSIVWPLVRCMKPPVLHAPSITITAKDIGDISKETIPEWSEF